MFKKKQEVPKYKSTDELLLYHQKNAVVAAFEILDRLKEHGETDTSNMILPITFYIRGLEQLVHEYSDKPRPRDFNPWQWRSQTRERPFPPVTLPPWLNIGGG